VTSTDRLSDDLLGRCLPRRFSIVDRLAAVVFVVRIHVISPSTCDTLTRLYSIRSGELYKQNSKFYADMK